MIVNSTRNQSFIESSSPHSIGLANNVTIPNPGWDSNPLLLTEKQLNGRSASNGFSGLGALFDGTGFLGTGLFVTGQPWGVGEYGLIALAVYLVFFQGQNKRYRGDWS